MSRYPQNTYVGMRYVPLFDGDWESEKDYEPLTVVNLDGNSYTSKTFVPAGMNPVGNTDYWAETGNYNAQIEAYRQEVLQYNDRIQANADAIASLDAKEDADINKLGNVKKNDVWAGIVICVGDSYLEGYTSKGKVTSWGEFIKKKKKITDNRFIASHKGGVGFSKTIDNINFLSLLKNAVSKTTPEDVTLIIIAGGYNDGSTNTTDSICDIVKYAKTACVNAEIYIGYCGYGATTQSPYQKAANYRYPQTCIKAGGKNLGNLAEILKANNSVAMDGFHPNEVGEELLANSIINIIDGGDPYSYTIPQMPAKFEGNNVLGNSFISINDGVFSLHVYGGNSIAVNVTGLITNKKVASYKIANENVNFFGGLFMDSSFPCFVKANETKYLPGIASLASSDEPNTLDLYVSCLNEAGNNFLNGMIGVLFTPFVATAPKGLL